MVRDSEGELRNRTAAVMKQQERRSAHVCESYGKPEKMKEVKQQGEELWVLCHGQSRPKELLPSEVSESRGEIPRYERERNGGEDGDARVATVVGWLCLIEG